MSLNTCTCSYSLIISVETKGGFLSDILEVYNTMNSNLYP